MSGNSLRKQADASCNKREHQQVTRFLLVLAAFVAVCAAAVFFLLENPDRFKSQITQAVEAGTGYEMQIDGELSWRYWPPLAIRVENVSLADDAGPRVSFEQVEADVDLLPLLTGQGTLDIGLISLTGGDIRILADETGNLNIGPAAQKDSGTTGPALFPTIRELRIKDLLVHYVDAAADTAYLIQVDSLTTTALNAAGGPLDVALSGKVGDKSRDISAGFRATGQLRTTNKGFSFDELFVLTRVETGGQAYPEINLVGEGEWRSEQQAILVNSANINLGAARLAFTGLVNIAGKTPRLDGNLDVESADLPLLGRQLGVDIPINTLILSTQISTTPDLVALRLLEGRFDNTAFKGNLSLKPGQRTAVKGEIRIPRFDANDYVNAATDTNDDEKNTNTDKQPENRMVIPVALLKENHLNVILRIDELKLDNQLFRGARFELENDTTNFNLNANVNAFGGKMVLTTETRMENTVQTQATISADKLDVQQLLDTESLTGILTGTARLQFSGSSLGDINRSITGQTVFSVLDGTLDVRPIKQLSQVIDKVWGKQSSVSAWPDMLPFQRAQGLHAFEGGFESGQIMTVTMENLDIAAVGGFDLADETLLYEVTTMFKNPEVGAFKVDEQLVDIRWPMTCEGSFSDSLTQLCVIQSGTISNLVSEIIKQSFERRGKDKLQEIIKEKAPEEYRDLAEKLFKDLFK